MTNATLRPIPTPITASTDARSAANARMEGETALITVYKLCPFSLCGDEHSVAEIVHATSGPAFQRRHAVQASAGNCLELCISWMFKGERRWPYESYRAFGGSRLRVRRSENETKRSHWAQGHTALFGSLPIDNRILGGSVSKPNGTSTLSYQFGESRPIACNC